MRTTRERRRGRARLALLVLGTAISLPGLGAANHLQCNVTGVGCPPFEPELVADTTFTYVNTQSTLYYRTDQNDHETPIVDLEYLVPKGWQFAVDKVRPAAQADGVTPATDCSQLYSGSAPKLLGNAEAIASTVGVRTRVGSGRAVAEYGFAGANRPNIAFMRWDPVGGPDLVGQADLCMYLRTSSTAVGGANEIIVPIELQKIAGNPDFEWRIDYNPMLFHWNAGLHGVNASVVYTNFFMNALSSGNWNLNTTTGAKEAIVWSRTPATPGNYTFRAVMTGCLRGLNPPASSPVCKDGVTVTRTEDDPVQIAHPPTTAIHDFGRITRVNGAGTLSGTGPSNNLVGLHGFSIVRSPNGDVPIEWEPPTLSPGDVVKGYALAVAYPGDLNNMHWEYFITDSTDVGFPPIGNEKVCGPSGTDPTCTTTLDFGSMNAGSKVLKRNGTFSIALVTIYKSGHRTDRGPDDQLMCDNGTGPGIPCVVTAPGFRSFRVNNPGISRWGLLLRDEPWLAFFNTRTPSGSSLRVINQVLLVDYTLGRAQFAFFNFEGPERVLAGSSTLIRGSGSNGTVNFGSGQLGGNGERFLYAGITSPLGANGVLEIYNLQGLPECLFTVCGGLPSTSTTIFSASQVS